MAPAHALRAHAVEDAVAIAPPRRRETRVEFCRRDLDRRQGDRIGLEVEVERLSAIQQSPRKPENEK